MPRFSTMTMAWAPATCFAISATTACFCSRFKPKVYLHACCHPALRGIEFGDLTPGKSCLQGHHLRRVRPSVAGAAMFRRAFQRRLSIKPSPLRSLTARLRGRRIRCRKSTASGVPDPVRSSLRSLKCCYSFPVASIACPTTAMLSVTPAPAARASTCRRAHPRPSCSTR